MTSKIGKPVEVVEKATGEIVATGKFLANKECVPYKCDDGEYYTRWNIIENDDPERYWDTHFNTKEYKLNWLKEESK